MAAIFMIYHECSLPHAKEAGANGLKWGVAVPWEDAASVFARVWDAGDRLQSLASTYPSTAFGLNKTLAKFSPAVFAQVWHALTWPTSAASKTLTTHMGPKVTLEKKEEMKDHYKMQNPRIGAEVTNHYKMQNPRIDPP